MGPLWKLEVHTLSFEATDRSGFSSTCVNPKKWNVIQVSVLHCVQSWTWTGRKKTFAKWKWYIVHDPSEEHVLIFARGCFSPQKHEKQHVLGLCKSPGESCNSIELISNIDHPSRVELRKYKVMFRRKFCRLKHERLECTQTIWVLLSGTTIDQNLVISPTNRKPWQEVSSNCRERLYHHALPTKTCKTHLQCAVRSLPSDVAWF